jgi:hypothetical protein
MIKTLLTISFFNILTSCAIFGYNSNNVITTENMKDLIGCKFVANVITDPRNNTNTNQIDELKTKTAKLNANLLYINPPITGSNQFSGEAYSCAHR